MKTHFIFQYKDAVSWNEKKIVTVIFISQIHIDQNELAQEINEFFQEYSFSDQLVVLLPEYATKETVEMFTNGRDSTFERLPGRSEQYYEESLLIYKYQSDSSLLHFWGKQPPRIIDFQHYLFRSGSAIIFNKNGGLVESTPDHHFVFPSKKHCGKFIRTGNVLVNSNEIFFLAFQLLKYFIGKSIIYCDTSSINVLPYTMFEMLRRFGIDFNCPVVNSFKSYEIFEANTQRFSDDALILISSSTSGNIVERLLKQRIAYKEQIKVLFFLGEEQAYNNHSESIICNLTYDRKSFEVGIIPFKTYNSEANCDLCKSHSRPVYIRSDVFLTIQPKVERVLIGVNQAPKNLSAFMNMYKSKNGKTIFKNYYKESDANADYEVFIDTIELFKNIPAYERFGRKIDNLINKYIPANVNCLIHLDDEGSTMLAHVIREKIGMHMPIIKLEKGFEEQITDQYKCAVIVASSINLGKDLLHVSRSLRKFEKLSIIYFVGLLRTMHEDYSTTLKSNLGKGKDESDERPLYAVEKFYCSPMKTNSSWFQEKLFLESMISDLEENTLLYKFVNDRLNDLVNNKKTIGLSDNVFLKLFNNESLILRKNFAFFNFKYNDKEIFQSEVYFAISSILTNLENLSIDDSYSLKQSNYSRKIICPGNFLRFNDGIIQACFLRAGKPDYFAYDLRDDLSLEMKTFLLSIIDQYDTEHGEALLEFLLAIGLRRVRLKRKDSFEVLKVASNCPNEVISGFANHVYKIVEAFPI